MDIEYDGIKPPYKMPKRIAGIETRKDTYSIGEDDVIAITRDDVGDCIVWGLAGDIIKIPNKEIITIGYIAKPTRCGSAFWAKIQLGANREIYHHKLHTYGDDIIRDSLELAFLNRTEYFGISLNHKEGSALRSVLINIPKLNTIFQKFTHDWELFDREKHCAIPRK